MKLLHIDSSVLGAMSASRQLTTKIRAKIVTANPGIDVEYLDLAADPPGHLNADSLGFAAGQSAELSSVQRRENATSEALVSQFLSADLIIVGAPLYNFNVPSQLKAWIDRIAQAGRTFKYTDRGAVGLATGKTVFIASSRGGVYSTSEAARAMEHQESYLQVMFGFLGITDIRIVRAEGLAMGDAVRAEAMRAASAEINALNVVSADESLVS